MARQVVKNPATGNYQIFSSVVDAFILEEEISKEELLRFWQQAYGERGVEQLEHMLAYEGQKLTTLDMSYEEALMWHNHSMGHKGGAQSPANSRSYPETCDICKESNGEAD